MLFATSQFHVVKSTNKKGQSDKDWPQGFILFDKCFNSPTRWVGKNKNIHLILRGSGPE